MTASAGENPLIPVWTFADRIQKIRVDVLRINQQQMADRLGVTKAAYTNWESRRGNYPRDILAVAGRISLMSGVPVMWILSGRENEDAGVGDSEVEMIRARIVQATLRDLAANAGKPSWFITPGGILTVKRDAQSVWAPVSYVA